MKMVSRSIDLISKKTNKQTNKQIARAAHGDRGNWD